MAYITHVNLSREAQKAQDTAHKTLLPAHIAGVTHPGTLSGYLRHDYHAEV